MKKLTAEWVRKAEEDYQVAVKTHRGGGSFPNAVCFHCEQAAEKYLMEECGLKVPKSHQLDTLHTLLLPHYAPLPFRRGLVFLTRFAVETRYPGDQASKREAQAAIRWAGKARAAARSLLGLPRGAVRRRKKSP